MDADGGKLHSQPAMQLNASLGCLDELRDVGVTGVEGRECVYDAYDGT